MEKTLTIVTALAVVHMIVASNVVFEPTKLREESGKNTSFKMTPMVALNQTAVVRLFNDKPEVADIPDEVELPAYSLDAVTVNLSSKKVGLCHISFNSTSAELGNLSQTFIEITIVRSDVMSIVIIVVGWIYFCAWSISFYPQIILNFQRKSVIGLNFDFLAFNITGFIAYGVFNVGMYWIKPVKAAYKAKNLYQVNPVLLNDVVFTLHAVVLTTVAIIQCFIYERGSQRVSITSRVLLSVMWLFALVTLIITAASQGSVITWLEYIYYFSYIKLAITLVKYIPQAFMNYKRKSTDGWSIGNVLLDFTGGAFSLLQMFFLSYNNDDWGSIFGDPTKFGLGVFSIAFDILFIIQHYVLYRGNARDNKYPEIDERDPLLGANNGHANDPSMTRSTESQRSINGTLKR